jgi:hypothetical protein
MVVFVPQLRPGGGGGARGSSGARSPATMSTSHWPCSRTPARRRRARQLYLEHGLDARDDSIGMQHYIDGWSFDPKRPCLVR